MIWVLGSVYPRFRVPKWILVYGSPGVLGDGYGYVKFSKLVLGLILHLVYGCLVLVYGYLVLVYGSLVLFIHLGELFIHLVYGS